MNRECTGTQPAKCRVADYTSFYIDARVQAMPGEVLYEVNISVDADVALAYDEWIVAHITEMLTFPGFLSAQLVQPDDTTPPSHETSQVQVKRTVIYTLASQEALQSYFDTHAARMRADGVAKFGGRFSAVRRISNVLGSYTAAT